jgi:hypothetical protein
MANGNVVWLILRQLTIAIAAVVRDWAKTPVYFAVSIFPGLKSGAIVDTDNGQVN